MRVPCCHGYHVGTMLPWVPCGYVFYCERRVLYHWENWRFLLFFYQRVLVPYTRKSYYAHHTVSTTAKSIGDPTSTTAFLPSDDTSTNASPPGGTDSTTTPPLGAASSTTTSPQCGAASTTTSTPGGLLVLLHRRKTALLGFLRHR